MWAALLLLPLAMARCLPSGDDVPINAALAKGGRGTTVTLCAGSVHRLSAPIVFTAPQQTLTTAATGHERALLIVEGEEQAVAVKADCKVCAGATISNLIVDGNRPHLLRVPGGGALLELGNAENQRVTGCRLFEPRGWSALHVREGDALNCRKAYVGDNVIGPCGEEWDDDYDGLEEQKPNWGNPRADGISLACKESVVERNVVFDTTDGAIVLFGSAGTTVRNNKVYARTRVVLGGVNLVDYAPWSGDYTGVRVERNEFFAHGRYFKVGIVVGPSSWIDDTENSVRGARVAHNTFHGTHFGYAIVVSSTTDFSVLANDASDASFDGVPGRDCPTAPPNAPPTAFLVNKGSVKATLQPEFVNGEVQHIICILPADSGTYVPWRMRDSPAAAAARDPNRDLDTRLADALVAYQETVLGAMRAVGARLNATGTETATGDARNGGGGGATRERGDVAQPDAGGSEREREREGGYDTRLDTLERSASTLAAELGLLEKDIAILATKAGEVADANRPRLLALYESLEQRVEARGSGSGGRNGNGKAISGGQGNGYGSDDGKGNGRPGNSKTKARTRTGSGTGSGTEGRGRHADVAGDDEGITARSVFGAMALVALVFLVYLCVMRQFGRRVGKNKVF